MIDANEARKLTSDAIAKAGEEDIERCFLKIKEAANAGLDEVFITSEDGASCEDELRRLGFAVRPYDESNFLVEWN